MKKLAPLILLSFLFQTELYSKGPDQLIKHLLDSLQQTEQVTQRIDLYHNIADQYLLYYNDLQTADSILQIAIKEAEATTDDEIIAYSYINYLKIQIRGLYSEQALMINQKLKDLVNRLENQDLKFDALSVICKSCENLGQECGISYADKVLLQAVNSVDPKKLIEANLLKAKCFKNRNQWDLAYSYYAEAELQILNLNEADQKIEKRKLYRDLSEFFNLINEYDLAIEYKDKEIELIKYQDPVNNFDKNWAMLEKLILSVKRDNNLPIKKKVFKFLDFAKEHHYKELSDYVLSFYRKHLIENQDFKGFKEVYQDRYPEELVTIQKVSEYRYNSIMAYINEANNRIDSAEYYWNKALSIAEIQNAAARVGFSNFRFGQFYLRNGQTEKALEKLENAYTTMDDMDIEGYKEEFKKEVAEVLKEAYLAIGDYKQAHKYTTDYYYYCERVDKRLNKDLIVQHGIQQNKLVVKKAELKSYAKKKKHKLQYWIIFIVVIIMLLILIAVGSMTVPAWLIQMMAFFSILAMVEFVLLLIDKQVYPFTGGEPLKKFFVKLAILTVFFPLHHLIEHKVTEYMLNNNIVGKPNWGKIKKSLSHLWPWLSDDKGQHGGH